MTEEKYNELRLKFLAFRDEYEAICKKHGIEIRIFTYELDGDSPKDYGKRSALLMTEIKNTKCLDYLGKGAWPKGEEYDIIEVFRE